MEQCVNCRTKKAVSHYGKKSLYCCFAQYHKVTKLQKDFNIPITTLTTAWKKKKKILALIRAYAKTQYRKRRNLFFNKSLAARLRFSLGALCMWINILKNSDFFESKNSSCLHI